MKRRPNRSRQARETVSFEEIVGAAVQRNRSEKARDAARAAGVRPFARSTWNAFVKETDPTRKSKFKRALDLEREAYFSFMQQQWDSDPRAARTDAAIQKTAREFNADADRIKRLLFFQGDLEREVGWVMMNEQEAQLRVKAARALRHVRRKFGDYWPFDYDLRSMLGPTRHPLSLNSDEEVMNEEVKRAEHELKQIQANRRAHGINKSPKSESFHKVRALSEVAFGLERYLTDCSLTECQRKCRDDAARDPDRAHDRTTVALRDKATRRAAELLNIAFPTISRLTAGRVRGRRSKKVGPSPLST